MRQVGVLAAAADVGVDAWEQNVTKSNRLALLFAKGVEKIENIKVCGPVESNLVILSSNV